ncbi:MAG TPA: hypothetical protein V6C65_31030 [Allocoleopsis sp.]
MSSPKTQSSSNHQDYSDQMAQQIREDIQPEQDIQPEEGIHHPDYEQQSRSQSDAGAQRANQSAGDDVTDAPEEA